MDADNWAGGQPLARHEDPLVGTVTILTSTAPAPVKRSIYHKTMRVLVTDEDAKRGYVDVTIDVYRVLRLFEVKDHNLAHAIKKTLVPGQRSGGKSADQDVAEAIWTLQRWEEMNREDKAAKP